MNLDFEYILELQPTDKMIKVSEVEKITGITRYYVYKLSKDKTSRFPRAYLVGQQSRWIEREITEWMKEREKGLNASKPLRQRLRRLAGHIGQAFARLRQSSEGSAGFISAPTAGSTAPNSTRKPAEHS